MCGAAAYSAVARSAELLSTCLPADDGKSIKCDLRLPGDYLGEKLRSAKVLWPGRTDTDEAALTPFVPGTDSSAYLFMFDRTASMPKEAIKTIKDDLIGIINRSDPSSHAIGFATFAERVDEVVPIGGSRDELTKAVGNLQLGGKSTALYQSVEAGLNILARYKTERNKRRATLIVISDGRSEDQEQVYIKDRTVNFAHQKGIVIYGVGYRTGVNEQRNGVQSLQRLAQETQGLFVEGNESTRKLPESFKSEFFPLLETGGGITFPNRAKTVDEASFTIQSQLVSGASLAGAVNLRGIEPRTGWWNWISDWWTGLSDFAKYAWAISSLAIVALAGLGAWIFMRRRRRVEAVYTTEDRYSIPGELPATTDGHGATGTFAPTVNLVSSNGAGGSGHGTNGAGPAYAWFKRVDNGDRFAMSKTIVNLGRHEDNDIRFNEESVHRRHAVVHMTPQRDFVITDLSPSGGNKAKLNSHSIEKEARLKDGDEVRLGEVRLKFEVSQV